MSKLERVLLESGSHSLDNLGDLAMLEVATDRILDLSPECRIQVVTRRPDRLAAYLPDVQPLGLPLSEWHLRLARQGARIPRSMRRAIADLLRLVFLRASRSSLSPAVRTAVSQSDLVLLSGSGILADPFSRPALRRLAVLEHAQGIGVPTALLGQGLGPFTQGALLTIASRVLPRAGLIGLRERLRGPAILSEMGMPDERIMITGDDSLALAYPEGKPQTVGPTLGLNLRLAPYSGVGSSSKELLLSMEASLKRFCQSESTLIGALGSHRDDFQHLQTALPELMRYVAAPRHHFNLNSLFASISRCRVVIAGSYHAAVFALAQGIPALCIANSPYYRAKFEGLADLFPEGCTVLDPTAEDSVSAMDPELRRLWLRAPDLRSELLQSTAEQIEWSRAAFRRLPELL